METVRSNKKISVVIVACAGSQYIKSCLDSIGNQEYPDLEVIVVSNAGSLNPQIIQLYPEIKVLTNKKNLFFCQAMNQGIAMSEGDFVLCLNDDVILGRNFIREAIKGFFYDDKVGMVSGKILRLDEKTIDSTGLFLSYWLTAKERGYGKKDNRQFEKKEYIFGVNGAAAFYRRAMLEEAKEGEDYFDSDFHIFYEDLDIAWRAQRLGWKGYYMPEATAYHVRGATVRGQRGIGKPYARRFLDDRLHMDLIKNRYLAIIKNQSFWSFLLHLPGFLVFEFILWIFVIFFRPNLIKIFLLNRNYFRGALRKRLSFKKRLSFLRLINAWFFKK